MSVIEAPPEDTLVVAFEMAAKHYAAKSQSRRWRRDPVGWCKEKIGQHLWSKQRDIIESVRDHKRTAVKSGHGVGKTHIAAAAIQWWIETHIGEDVMVVTTAPSVDQVVGVLWEYIRKSHTKYGLTGKVTEDAKWKDDQRNIIGIGRKPADGNTTSFQGRHYKYTLIIIDEACGISAELFTAIDAIATTDTCRVLAIGNPTDPNTPFGNIFLGNGGKGLDAWNKLTISVLDNPNFTDEECPSEVKEALSSKQWVADKAAEVGMDSMDWKSRVLGEFPESSEDSLFPIHLLYKCMDVPLRENEFDWVKPWFGVDISRYGSDSSAIVKYHPGTNELTVIDTWKDANGPEGAAIIHRHAIEHGVSEVRIDGAGPGTSVIDHLLPMSVNFYTVVVMDGGGASPNNQKWLNARAFWHGNLKRLMMDNKIRLPSVLGNPKAQRLFDELQGIKYMMNLTYSSMQIESKEAMRRKGIKSPDISDAACYATAPSNVDDPLAGFDPGEVVTTDPWELFEEYDRGWEISPV